jgi:hypothetical protein
VIRQIVYQADTQRIEIEFQPDAAIGGERLVEEVLGTV